MKNTYFSAVTAIILLMIMGAMSACSSRPAIDNSSARAEKSERSRQASEQAQENLQRALGR